MEIKGKNIIVTGGAGGIGSRLVGKLADRGAHVCVFDIDPTAMDRIRTANTQIDCVQCDVSDPKQVEKSVNDHFEKQGGIDVLINNAGMIYNGLLVGMNKGKMVPHDRSAWERVMAVNLNAVFYMTSFVVQKMLSARTSGLIVNVSSISSAGNAGQSAYSATKAAVRSLTVTWSKELAPWGIRVAGIAPGFTKTDAMTRSMSDEVLKEWIQHTPQRRLADPNEITDGIMFIIQNDFYNGRTLELDGGLRI